MLVKLLGKNLNDITPLLDKYDLTVTESGSFDAVITHGGDGAMLGAERVYPGIPKFPIRDAATAPTALNISLKTDSKHLPQVNWL